MKIYVKDVIKDFESVTESMPVKDSATDFIPPPKSLSPKDVFKLF